LDFDSPLGLEEGNKVKIVTDNESYEGIVMPRYKLSGNDIIIIKIFNQSIVDKTYGTNTNNKLALLSTGGTIASKIDYVTGGVHPTISPQEIYQSNPEIAQYAHIDTELIMNEYSENISPSDWTMIAERVYEKINSKKYQGIIVFHGTDTMHYTAAALSFALVNSEIPVVFVGSQRSSDRPSSDASLNLLGASIFASKSMYCGIFISMHSTSSDNIIACHLGTRVRKNHTSRRDAFSSIGLKPIATIEDESIKYNINHSIRLYKRNGNKLIYKPKFDDKVVLLKYYPGFKPELLRYFIDKGYRAIVLEGTGLGHVNKNLFHALSNVLDSNIPVFMTSQCIWGKTNMNVYNTGRELLKIGLIPLSDMLPETALVKAMWALSNTTDNESFIELMRKNIANEILDVSEYSETWR
jgi:glutamyl-tRNA(Gln) amidotransferase subunit D